MIHQHVSINPTQTGAKKWRRRNLLVVAGALSYETQVLLVAVDKLLRDAFGSGSARRGCSKPRTPLPRERAHPNLDIERLEVPEDVSLQTFPPPSPIVIDGTAREDGKVRPRSRRSRGSERLPIPKCVEYEKWRGARNLEKCSLFHHAGSCCPDD